MIVAFMTGATPPAVFWVAVTLGLVWLVLRNNQKYQEERSRRERAVALAQQALTNVRQRWERDVATLEGAFAEKRRDLELRKTEYQGLPAWYQQQRTKLNAEREALQRRHFLEQFFIQRHRITGIGPSLTATLASYGVETAADVTFAKVMAVPGFGPTRTKVLMAWRAGLEQRFRFNPNQAVDPRDITALDQRHAAWRNDLERVLSSGAQELQKIRSLATQRQTALLAELQTVTDEFAQAKADFAAL